MNDTPGKMLSSLAGNSGDKQNPKIGGCVGVFFNLFDWNKRLTGKKLFSNRLLPAERPSKQTSNKCADDKLPMAKLLLIADENRGGFPRRSTSGDSMASFDEGSRTSSDDANTKAPGVVARLMGLDSLPAPEPTEHSKELGNSKAQEMRPLPQLMHQRRQYEQPGTDGSDSIRHHAKLNGMLKKSAETRPQKLQKTGFFEKKPISKFQPDTLPFKTIVSPNKSKVHGKMMSPIKSPGILSAKNAARLMEAAAKILEPGMQTTNKARNPLIRGSVARPLLKDQDGEKREFSKKINKVSDPMRKSVPPQSSGAKTFKGQQLNKSWSGKEASGTLRPNTESAFASTVPAKENSIPAVQQDTDKRKIKPSGLPAKQESLRTQTKLGTSKSTAMKKQQQKTVSLALEAKANVQKREIEGALQNNIHDVSSANDTNECLERAGEIRKRNKVEEQTDDMKDRVQLPELKEKKTGPRQGTSGLSKSSKQNTTGFVSKSSAQSQIREKTQTKSNRTITKTGRISSGETSSRTTNRNSQSMRESVLSNRNHNGSRPSANAKNIVSRKDTAKDKEGTKTQAEVNKIDLSSTAIASPKKKRTSDELLAGESMTLQFSELENEYNHSHEPERSSMVSTRDNSLLRVDDSRRFDVYVDGASKPRWLCGQDSQGSNKSIDVVSFTFSSPMRSTSASQSGSNSIDNKQRQESLYHAREREADVSCSSSSSFQSDSIGGDTLNALLEQKLKELTSTGRIDLVTGNPLKDNSSSKTTASILQDLILTLNTDRSNRESPHDSVVSSNSISNFKNASTSNCTSVEYTRPLVRGNILQDKDGECLRDKSTSGRLSCMDAERSERLFSEDCDQPSPVSILEASFSNESCNSAESLDVQAEDRLQLLRASVHNRTQMHHVDSELCDSASSANLEVVENDKIMDAILDISRLHKIDPSSIGLSETEFTCTDDQELEYAREIILNSELMSEDVGLLSEEDIPDFLVDPNLFDVLDSRSTSTDVHSKNGSHNSSSRKPRGSWQNRKLFFDCVKECLCSKYSSRFRGGYNTWAKGAYFVSEEKLAKDIFSEIQQLRLIGSGMLDEIVERDMSTPSGKWTDVEREMFEIGSELENSILSSLVDEFVHELLSC